jgi:hypothetical protein
VNDYDLWNPFAAGRTLEFVITMAEGGEIGSGTGAFVSQLVGQIGVEGNVEAWSLTTCRSPYYTDYLDSDDWRDRWQVAWKARVELDRDVELPELPPDGIVPADAEDASWSEENDFLKLESARCLVVADFPEPSALEHAQAAIELGLRSSTSASASFGQSRGMLKYPQLHVDLGEFGNEFFTEDAPAAQPVLALCAEYGGSLNFRLTFARDAAGSW